MPALVRLLARGSSLRLLLAAGLISLVGDWILRVGLAYEVYALTGSTIASSAMLMASLLPQILLGSVAGVFADRWDRRVTMVVTNLLLAAGLIALIRLPRGTAARPDTGHQDPAARALRTTVRSVWRDWAEGVRVARAVRTLRVLLLFVAITSVGEGIMGTLMAPFVRDVLHGDSSAYGLIMSVQAVGGILGGLVAAGVGHRFRPQRLVGWGAVAFGALDLALFLYRLAAPVLWPAFVLIALVGPAGALMAAGLMTVFQTATGERLRGRVFGALIAVEGVALAAAAATTVGVLAAVLPARRAARVDPLGAVAAE